MKDEVSKELKQFVEEKRWKYDFPLIMSTQLEDDLQITGDDAVDFLIAFGERFNVDVSEFKAAEYFEPEGDIILPAIIRLFKGEKKRKLKVLTLGHLENAIFHKKLNDDIINLTQNQ
jgi:acyl carrier protein